MPLPVLRPGQTHPAVLKLKKSVVHKLESGPHSGLATAIRLDSKTYGPTTVRAAKQVQKNAQLTPDGVVGEHTWRALGFHDPVVDERPPALHGIPYEPGLLAVDGHWVDKPLALVILSERRAGRWHGTVNSGYRPAWYQQRLWDAAVRKYGSEQAAAKWVARPGHSNHGKKGGTGAVDVQHGEELDRSDQLFRPYSWEAWHVQLAGTRDMPGEPGPPGEPESLEPPHDELEQAGVTLDDVDAAIGQVLDQLDKDNAQSDETRQAAADDGYEPEAAAPTREPEAVS